MGYNVQRIWTWESTFDGFYFNNDNEAGVTIASNRCKCTLDGRTATTSAVTAPALLGYSYIAFANTVVTQYAGAAGTVCRLFEIGSYFVCVVKQSDATKYKVQLRRAATDAILGTGTTDFAFGTQYDWVIARDNITGPRIYWNDMTTIEVSGADFGSVDSFKFSTSNVDATAYVEVGVGCFVESNTAGVNRPDPTTLVGGALLVQASGSTIPHHQDYTHHFNTPTSTAYGAPTTDLTKHDQVDDISNPDDESTSLENPATTNTTFRQTHHTSSPTISNCKAVEFHQRTKATVASKTLTSWSILCNGSTETETSFGNISLSTYQDNASIHETPPGGSGQGWAQSDLDSLQIGARWDVGADAVTLRLTSIFAEALGFDFNPEPGAPTTGQRRRGGVF